MAAEAVQILQKLDEPEPLVVVVVLMEVHLLLAPVVLERLVRVRRVVMLMILLQLLLEVAVAVQPVLV